MKHRTMQTLVFALTAAVAMTAFAQGRHDEKPHGQQKPAQASKEGESRAPAMTGGRHDERPHGPPKTAAKKDSAGKADDMHKKEMMKNESDMGKGMK